ncbi:hypothetical protein J7K27_10155, partial [Candidatus Bathyarchaeota archaeon]|nr:hypothetical protein [Candidatus Bathyarchaeota archaeon]
NLVSLLSDYLSENKSSTTSHNSQTRKNKEIEKKHSFKSSNLLFGSTSLNVRKIRNFFRVISIFLILIVFVSGFISCAFLFGSGLQVFSLQKSYVAPYYWISNESGEFKIVTVNNSPGEWLGLEAETDFAFSGMLTEVGWWHDIGSDSSFIHDKPVLQNGGWDFHSRWFVDFLRFKVAREELTDHLFEVLGIFNYKYIVVPCYASKKIRTFFINQEGGEIAYNCSNSLILRNKFYTPRFFAAENYSVVVGGLESFLSLAKIDDFNFTENALFFADRNYKLLEENLFRNSSSLIFVNSDLLELVMLTMKDSIIDASDYGFKSLNYTKYWVKWPSWRTVGSFVYWGDTLTTNGVNIVKIPFKVERDGNYTIWIRLGFAPSRGKLTVTVDDLFQTEVKPEAKFWSEPEWINLTNLNLRKGDHIITIRNDGKGYNDIDSIAIIETSKFQEQKSKILKAIKESETPIVYLLEAEINFLEDPCSKWNYKKYLYNDYLIYPEEAGTEKTELYIPKEGSYQFFARVLKGPECGVLRLLVDDKVLNASCYAENLGFEWLNLGSVYLSQGAHEIGVGAEGYVELDLIAVASTKNGKQLNSLGELFQGSFERPAVNFEKLNPCEYRVHAKTEEPFILVFSDAYHPLWRAILDDGTEVKPVNLYHIVNGFFINRTGEFNLTVRFIGQDYVDLGFKISLVTFILVLGLLVIPERTYLKARKRLANLKRAIHTRF